MKKCRAVDIERPPARDGRGFLVAVMDVFKAPLCDEDAVAETTLGPKCERHLDEFRAAMADPNAAINVLAGRTPTTEQIEAMIRPIH